MKMMIKKYLKVEWPVRELNPDLPKTKVNKFDVTSSECEDYWRKTGEIQASSISLTKQFWN